MMSKNLLCNLKLLWEGVKRHAWLPSLYSTVLFFMLPVYCVANGQDVQRKIAEQWDDTFEYCREIIMSAFTNKGIMFFAIFAGIIAAAAVFFYINSKKQVDFYHSQPISRTRLYFNKIIIGMAAFILPYAIMTLISVGIIAVMGLGSYIDFFDLSAFFGLSVLLYVLHFFTALLAVMLCGNLLTALLGTGVFMGYGSVMCLMYEAYMQHFYSTYYSIYTKLEKMAMNFSPALYFLESDMSDFTAKRLICYIAAVIILACVCLWLYKKRQSEAAGKSIAFNIAKPIIKYPLVFFAASFLGLTFGEITYGEGWTIFGFICGILLSHAIIEIIYERELKAVRKNLIPLAAFTLIFAGIYIVMRFDLTGYNKWLPSREEVSAAYIDMNAGYSYSRQAYWNNEDRTERFLMRQPECIDAVYHIAEGAVRYMNEEYTEQETQAAKGYSVGYVNSVSVGFKLKNGRMKYRQYYFDDEQAQSVMQYVYNLYDTDEFKTKFYDLVYYYSTDEGRENMKSVSFENVYFEDMYGNETRLTEDTEDLIAAANTDIMSISSEYVSQNLPLGNLVFEMQIKREYGGYEGWYWATFYMPVYEQSKLTINLLEELGVDLKQDLQFVPNKLRVYSYDESMPSLLIENADDIQKLLPYIDNENVRGMTMFYAQRYKYYAEDETDGKYYYIKDSSAADEILAHAKAVSE